MQLLTELLQLLTEGEFVMDWEQVQHLVESQISCWRAVGKHDWAEALEQCLARAERCQSMQDVVLDLRQRLEQTEAKENPRGDRSSATASLWA